MGKRLDTERQELLEPKRIEYAKKKIIETGAIILFSDEKSVQFLHKGKTITIWPYSGWFSGKGIKDGRGIENLIKQLGDNQ